MNWSECLCELPSGESSGAVLIAKPYTRIAVAKFAPQNRCFAPDGSVLLLDDDIPIAPRDGRRHRFVCASDFKATSQYAWVCDVDSFAMEEFRPKFAPLLPSAYPDDLILILLSSIACISSGTPIASDFAHRLFPARTELTVHAVVFGRARA